MSKVGRKTIQGKDPNDELFTPKWILDWVGPIDLDPCWSPLSFVRPQWYLDARADGLDHDWVWPGVRTVFVNPPYSNLSDWVKKCECVSRTSSCLVVALVPARTGTNYWKTYVWGKAAAIGFIMGRIAHPRADGAKSVKGTFDSALICWGSEEQIEPILQRQIQSNTGQDVAWVFKQEEAYTWTA